MQARCFYQKVNIYLFFHANRDWARILLQDDDECKAFNVRGDEMSMCNVVSLFPVTNFMEH